MTPEIGEILLRILTILVAAKLAGEIAERLSQPAVFGEILAGILIGPSVFGIIREDEIIMVLAELGVIILLFEVGLNTDIEDMAKVGIDSLLVALIGVFCPFLLGYLVVLFLNIGENPLMMAIFMGATLTATSVGITARVYRDLSKVNTREARVVLGAAVIDDVIGLIILAVVVSMMDTGRVSLETIVRSTLYALTFLILSFLIGLKIVTGLFDEVIRKLKVEGLVIVTAFTFCLIMAYLANLIGLATIVGAFAAGLILAQTHHDKEITEQIFPLAQVFVPVFFVMMGVFVNLKNITTGVLTLALIITTVAIIGKVVAGYGVIRSKLNRFAVGVGMIPRGEVGLIFASFGLIKGIISQSTYSAVIAMVLITTLVTPPLLKITMKRVD
ncbi:MAG: cation:proton antiporter [Candidatus Methanofastidiosia archaeon]